MKYLDKKFNTPGNSRAYVEGWERCFGEERDYSRCHGGMPGCDCALPTYAGLECARHEVTEGESRVVE